MNKQFLYPAAASVLMLACLFAIPALAAGPPVAPERVPYYWMVTNSAVEATIPNSGHNMQEPGCASVRYSIGSDGETRDVELGKVVPASDLGPVAVSIVENFHYQAAVENPAERPIRTYYTVQFNMRALDAHQRERMMAACDLPGYEIQ